MRDWRAAWYQANPEGLVGRLRNLARSRPEAARALATRLEREGWGPWWELLDDLRAPRALCPACEGRGVALTSPWPSWATPDIRPEVDCPNCHGEGLVPYPVEEWTEICPECGGRGGGYDYLDTRYPIDNPPWVDCPFCGGEGRVTKTGYEGSSRDLPEEPLPF